MPEPESHADRLPPGDALQRRRRDIRRGLTRSHTAVAVALGFVGLIALVALWRQDEARQAQRNSEDNAAKAQAASARLWDLCRRTARQERLSRAAGQRTESLEFIREAAGLRPSRELRDEALSALLLPDLGTNVFWQVEEGFDVALTYDRDLQHGIIHNTRGRALVRRTSDGTALLDTPGLDAYTTFGEFSPDGRLAAVAFCDTEYRTASIGVWEWRSANLLARLSAVQPIRPGSPQRPVGFAPDGQRLWLLTPAGELSVYDLQTKELQRVIVPGHPAHSLRLSPSGTSVALGCGNILEVWDLTSHAERAALTLTNEIWHLAWQPGEERLAIGCYGGLYLWDIGAPEAVRLPERAPVAITELSFDGDGGFLFSGGWFELGEVWDVRQLQRILEPGAGHLVQLSQDQRRLAIGRERVVYGIRQFLPPRGIRSWPGPVSLGRAGSEADLDPAERWLLTAQPGAGCCATPTRAGSSRANPVTSSAPRPLPRMARTCWPGPPPGCAGGRW